jgi:RND family efflux transporter MFP subunit
MRSPRADHWTALILSVAAIGCHSKGPAGMPAFPPAEVDVAHPVQRVMTDTRRYTGRFEAVERVEIRARVKGYLSKVNFTEGAEVKKGDLLYEIDPSTFEAEIARAEADVARLESQLRMTALEAERAIRLHRSTAVAEEELHQKIAARDANKGGLASAKATLESAKLELGFTKIVAPIDGRISRTLVTVGNLVGQSEPTLLTTLVRMDKLHLYFEVPERDYLQEHARLVQAKAPAGAEKAAGATAAPTQPGRQAVHFQLDGEQDFIHEGFIDFQDNQLDPQTGTILVRAEVANPNRLLTPGLFARVKIPFGRPTPRLLVPEEALGSDQRGRFVLTVAKDDVVKAVPVSVGFTVDGVAVLGDKALSPEDRVVIKGVVKARPGAPVKPNLVTFPLPNPSDDGAVAAGKPAPPPQAAVIRNAAR